MPAMLVPPTVTPFTPRPVATISDAPATTMLRWSEKSTFASSQIFTPISAIRP